MSRSREKGKTDAYESWLAAQVMQTILRCGKYPMKASNEKEVRRITEYIKRKWGLHCRIDFEKSELNPAKHYIIKADQTPHIEIAELLRLIDLYRTLIVNGSYEAAAASEQPLQRDIQLLKQLFDVQCRLEQTGCNTEPIFMIVRQ
jgi:hypothetical protein